MEIYALVGSSGTGKSYHAMDIANEYQITHIIDDGILISRGKKVAGKSAKAEKTMVGAVKCAIFNDRLHCNQVKQAIDKEKPKKILILGTSEHMIDRIIEALGLNAPQKIIFIEEVSTPENIAIAREMRSLGKHIIPLPSVEVKNDFKNYWLAPVAHFFIRKNKKDNHSNVEKTIVRPTFSELGKVTISEQVVNEIVIHISKKYELFKDSLKVAVKIVDYSVSLRCELRMSYGEPIQKYIKSFQEEIKMTLEFITGLEVVKIHIIITGLM